MSLLPRPLRSDGDADRELNLNTMSLVFSDTQNYRGIVQMYEKECGFKRGDISGNTERLKEFTADVNEALDNFTALAIPASGTWEFDDSNHTDYPIITTNIVNGQRDYPFTEDETGNLILDIYKVVVYDSLGNGRELEPLSMQTMDRNGEDRYIADFYNGQNFEGVPTRYDKTANAIFLDYIPNYDRDDALKVYINREAAYFSYMNTTKKPGVPGLFHKYFYLKPARDYARRNDLASFNRLESEVLKLEGIPERGVLGSIQMYFGKRERDIPRRLTAARTNTK